ncbi:solute carrier family 23 protein [Clostridium sp.]|uniref:solute carrier family 23 protein n=1 Tax=Clostridium sp. TaxID=1506 RepID=UPI0025BF65CB|nr:solute carrier family 23 protein [Clostridium sp.]
MKNLKEWILSIQHLFAMFGACVLVPLLVGINPSIAILTAGIGTLIFHLCTKGKVPVFLGSSFAFITPIITISTMYNDYSYVQGGIIVVGLIYTLMSFIVYKIGVDKINKLLPSHVVGAMIIVIGLSLVPSAITNIQTNTMIALVTLGISLLITFLGRGFIKQLGILIGVVCGYILALSMGIVDTSVIQNANLITLPSLTLPKFSLEAIMIIAPLSLCTLCEHIGDITTNGTVVGKDFVKDPGLHRTLLGDGLATMVAGFMGSCVNTTYGENTSLLAITKNYNPKLLRRTAIIAIVLSFIGVFGAILQSVPACVIGGISLQLYFMIAWIGVKNIKDNKSYKSIKKLIVIAIILIVGLSGFTITLGTVAISGLALAVIVGVILNLVLNHKDM